MEDLASLTRSVAVSQPCVESRKSCFAWYCSKPRHFLRQKNRQTGSMMLCLTLFRIHEKDISKITDVNTVHSATMAILKRNILLLQWVQLPETIKRSIDHLNSQGKRPE